VHRAAPPCSGRNGSGVGVGAFGCGGCGGCADDDRGVTRREEAALALEHDSMASCCGDPGSRRVRESGAATRHHAGPSGTPNTPSTRADAGPEWRDRAAAAVATNRSSPRDRFEIRSRGHAPDRVHRGARGGGDRPLSVTDSCRRCRSSARHLEPNATILLRMNRASCRRGKRSRWASSRGNRRSMPIDRARRSAPAPLPSSRTPSRHARGRSPAHA
jgi:hypothetical protein